MPHLALQLSHCRRRVSLPRSLTAFLPPPPLWVKQTADGRWPLFNLSPFQPAKRRALYELTTWLGSPCRQTLSDGWHPPTLLSPRLPSPTPCHSCLPLPQSRLGRTDPPGLSRLRSADVASAVWRVDAAAGHKAGGSVERHRRPNLHQPQFSNYTHVVTRLEDGTLMMLERHGFSPSATSERQLLFCCCLLLVASGLLLTRRPCEQYRQIVAAAQRGLGGGVLFCARYAYMCRARLPLR